MSERPILLVEDNPDDVELALIAFQRIGFRHRVETARDGAEALDLLFPPEPRREAPLLVVLDLKLPRINGFEVLRKIRADPGLKELPVAVLTSSGEDRDRQEALRLGADHFFRKAVDFQEFVDVARAIARLVPGEQA